ncbi:ankyrin repeat domain-containing protein, partial [Planctomycetota bacterium]
MTVNPDLTATVLAEPGRRQAAVSTAPMLISKGATVSPIHWAAFVGDAAKVLQLLDQGVDVNAKDTAFDNATPLHLATLGESEDVIRVLVSRAADINAKTESIGFTALHMATSIDVAELLIDEGAEVNIRSKWAEYAPLHLAVVSGRMEMVKLLIAKGADVDGGDPTPLEAIGIGAGQSLMDKPEGASDLAALRSIFDNRMAVAQVLISAGADYSRLRHGSSLLHQAANADARELVKLMLTHGADANGKVAGRTPLHVMAGMLKNQAMVELLLTHGADINAEDSAGATPLTHAKRYRNTAIADLLAKHGGIDPSPPASLHEVARDGNLEQVKSLVTAGGDVNAQSDRWGGTPLHLAVSSGRRQVIEFLIANGADVNAQNRYGRTPLDDVIDRGQTEITEMLQKVGAKVGNPIISPASNSGPSFFQRAAKRYTIAEEKLQIPEDEQSCAANLKRIHTALERYEKEKGGLPHWLSDLVPDYLPQEALLCPGHLEYRATFTYFEPQTPMEPRLPCGYAYEFSMSRLPAGSPGSPTGRMITRDRKMAQM